MKRIAVILLLPVLLFNTIGYYLVFYGDLLEARHEASVLIWGHEALGEKMVSLTFPTKNGKAEALSLSFTDEDEFMYQGRMYDVVSSSSSDGYIVFRCYTDNKETALNQELTGKINTDSDTPAQHHKNTSVLKEFIKDYTPHQHIVFCPVPSVVFSFIHPDRARQQPYIYSAVVSPPPEFLS